MTRRTVQCNKDTEEKNWQQIQQWVIGNKHSISITVQKKVQMYLSICRLEGVDIGFFEKLASLHINLLLRLHIHHGAKKGDGYGVLIGG